MRSKWASPGPSGRDSNTDFGPASPEPGAPGNTSPSVNDQDDVIRAANAAFGTNASGPTNPGWMVGSSETPTLSDESAGDANE